LYSILGAEYPRLERVATALLVLGHGLSAFFMHARITRMGLVILAKFCSHKLKIFVR
jgi:hypothetical protein